MDMTLEEALDVIDDLKNDVWYGVDRGKPIYVCDTEYEALEIAKSVIEEKING